jgi:hypothetical protein
MNREEDRRNRPEEFSDDKKLTKEELIRLTAELKSDFVAAIDDLDPSRLTEQRRIQGYEVTLLRAIFRALTHLEGHIGQIVLLARIQTDDYKIFWTPQTDEQRAERKKSE